MSIRAASSQVFAFVFCSSLASGAALAQTPDTAPAREDTPTYRALSALNAEAGADSASAVFADLADLADLPAGAGSNAVDAAVGDVRLSLPADPRHPVRLRSDRGRVDVGLPLGDSSAPARTLGAGVVVYENAAGFGTVPLVKSDASVQFTTVIHHAQAPDSYTYDFAGKTLELQPDGLVVVRDDRRAIAGIVAAAWAKDAAGAPVRTHYVVSGSRLTQVVEHDAKDAATYPVVAGIYLGGAQIQSISNAYRDPRGVTKVVTPTAWGRLNGNNPTAVNGMRDEYLSKVSAAYRTNGMWWQLACHMQFAPIKSTWNLDSYIVRGSYADYIAHGCN